MHLFVFDELNKAWQYLLDKMPEEAWHSYKQKQYEFSELDNALFLGHYQLVSQNYKEAVASLIFAKKAADELADTNKLLTSLELLTSLYLKIADYTAAAENCLEYIEQIQDSKQPKEKLLEAFLQLGNIYQNTHNFKEAIANYTRANKIAKQLKNVKQDSETLFKIGNAYNWNEELDLSEKFLLENIAINKKEGFYNAWSHASLGILYTKQERNDEALSTFELSLAEAKVAKDHQLIANISKSLGNLHIIMGNLDKAIEVLSEAIRISEELNLKTVLMKANEFMADALEKKGELDKAYQYFKTYFALNEEIKQANTDVKLKGLQLKYDLDVQETFGQARDLANDAAGRGDFIALGNGFNHGAVFFLALHLGANHDEIQHHEHQHQRQHARERGHDVTATRGGGRSGLGESRRNKHGQDSTMDGQKTKRAAGALHKRRPGAELAIVCGPLRRPQGLRPRPTPGVCRAR